RRSSDLFTAALASRAATVRVGDPFDPATEVGPLVNGEHFRKVAGYLELGEREGARLASGGLATELGGNYVRPTLFTGVTSGMSIARQEIFGPVLVAIPFADEAEALTIAND